MTIHNNMFDNDKEKAKSAFGSESIEWEEGPLKDILVEYVGASANAEEVTAVMIIETMAKEFPEFLMAGAEENWIRGYQQAIHDVDQGQRLLHEHAQNEEVLEDGNS